MKEWEEIGKRQIRTKTEKEKDGKRDSEIEIWGGEEIVKENGDSNKESVTFP